MTSTPALFEDEEEIVALIVDDVSKAVQDGRCSQRELLALAVSWRKSGASEQTCKVARQMGTIFCASRSTSGGTTSSFIGSLTKSVAETNRIYRPHMPNDGDAARIFTGSADLDVRKPPKLPVVFIVHGIKTLAPWMENLASELRAAGFSPEILSYGEFRARDFARQKHRDAKVDWLLREYDNRGHDEPEYRPSVIAHSFGTYMVARCVSKHNLKFDKVILCGSIVHPKYPWKDVFEQGLATSLLNDSGEKDIWVRSVAYLVRDAGQSGLKGFSDVEDLPVVQISRPYFKHSDFFNRNNYVNNWIPFLKGDVPAACKAIPHDPPNLRFWIVWGVVAAVGLLCIAYWMLTR